MNMPVLRSVTQTPPPILATAADTRMDEDSAAMLTTHGLSVILPAYNEEACVPDTVRTVVDALRQWVEDYEVIVVNDGSADNTGPLVSALAEADPHIRCVNHEVNRGYGAALVTGFEAAQKDLVFFMDSDGQFDIQDLKAFFPLIDTNDAVLGYRYDRQDTEMRKLNAWGWKTMVWLALGVRVRDVDCAFKLLHTDFFRTYALETRGAMINAEMLATLRRSGGTFAQVPVQHLPRRSGKATGANPRVIIRAFGELASYTWRWRVRPSLVRAKAEGMERLQWVATQVGGRLPHLPGAME